MTAMSPRINLAKWSLDVAALGAGVFVAAFFTSNGTPRFADPVEHFKYGSIGSEPESGFPYHIWQALPGL